MNTTTRITLLAILAIAPTVGAEIIFDEGPFTGPPPAVFGGYEMVPFPLDERPLFENVVNLPSPLGGDVDFSIPMSHRRIGSGWSILGHGYEGDMYYSNGAYSVALTLPPGTTAFYFYASANAFLDFTVTADDGTSSGMMDDYWARDSPFVGFYATDGDVIETLTLDGVGDFALGDFGIGVPEAGSLALLALGGFVLIGRR